MKDKKTGKTLKREKPKKTKQGMVFTSIDNKHWQIEYPDGEGRYGGNTTSERVAIFFLLLGMSHTLENAREIAFHKTNLRGKHVDNNK